MELRGQALFWQPHQNRTDVTFRHCQYSQHKTLMCLIIFYFCVLEIWNFKDLEDKLNMSEGANSWSLIKYKLNVFTPLNSRRGEQLYVLCCWAELELSYRTNENFISLVYISSATPSWHGMYGPKLTFLKQKLVFLSLRCVGKCCGYSIRQLLLSRVLIRSKYTPHNH